VTRAALQAVPGGSRRTPPAVRPVGAVPGSVAADARPGRRVGAGRRHRPDLYLVDDGARPIPGRGWDLPGTVLGAEPEDRESLAVSGL
jgi:hypothetical protein